MEETTMVHVSIFLKLLFFFFFFLSKYKGRMGNEKDASNTKYGWATQQTPKETSTMQINHKTIGNERLAHLSIGLLAKKKATTNGGLMRQSIEAHYKCFFFFFLNNKYFYYNSVIGVIFTMFIVD
jgi:hypothetical protein